jgi:hypothetical protein
VQAPTRTALSGPALVRLLARIADLDVPAPASSLSDRLSQWLGWTDAIALSTALAGETPAVSGASSAVQAEADASAQTRAALVRAIVSDERAEAAARGRHRAAPKPLAGIPVDYAVFRQRYLTLQQTMESDIGALRGRLRAVLAAPSSDLTRLAAVDAVMEQALAQRERTSFAQVPVLLGKYFERLRRAHAPVSDGKDGEDAPAPDDSWLDAFREDMQNVLLAELEVRFQPVEGLLAALRPR